MKIVIHHEVRDADFSSFSEEKLRELEQMLWSKASEAGSKARDFDLQRRQLEEQARAAKREIEKRGRNG